MHIQDRNNGRALILLVMTANVAIISMPVSATANSLVTTLPKLNLSETLDRAANDDSERFMREQLHSGGSNLPTPLQNDGWSQPIGWLFGLMFVILGSIVAWSKYTQKR